MVYAMPPSTSSGRRNRLEIDLQNDFTGGLNLRRDMFNLAENESPDLMNVDVGMRGGFRLRNGMKPHVEAPVPRDVDSLIPFYKSDGTRQLIVAGDGGLWWFDGTTWSAISTATNEEGLTVGASMKDKIYLSHPAYTDFVRRWDGSTHVTVPDPIATGGSWNNDIQNPTTSGTGSMPAGPLKAVHHEVMWSSTSSMPGASEPHGHRLRWSHPGFPEDWRQNDFIDFDQNQGPITALVPFGDRLLVFFEKAIYAVHGYPPNAFSVTNVTKQVGTPSPQGVVASEIAVYFWDEQMGACRLDSRGVEYLFEPLQSMFQDSTLNEHLSGDTRVGIHGRRVYFSLWTNENLTGHERLMYVYDIDLRAWVRHDNPPNAYLPHFHPETGEHIHILGGYGPYVYELDVPGLKHDRLYVENVDEFFNFKIKAHFVTRWFDANNFVERKRWKRPEIALLSGATAVYRIGVLKDYNPRRVVREFRVRTVAGQVDVNGLLEAIWNQSEWDDAVWAGGSEILPTPEIAEVLRGAPLGNARAVALKFFGPEMVEGNGEEA